MVGLKKVNIPVNLGNGLSQKTDSKIVATGRLVELINGRFEKLGRTSKRFGSTLLPRTVLNGDAIDRAVALTVWNEELNLCDGNDFYSYLPSLNTWIDKGNAVSCILTSYPVVQNDDVHTNVSIAHNSGLICSVYMVGSDINYSIQDIESKTTIVYDQLVSASGSRPLVLAFRNYFVIMYIVSGTIRYRLVSINTPTTLASEVSFITDLDGSAAYYDAVVIGEYIWIVYNDVGGNVYLRRLNYVFSLSLADTIDTTPIDLAVNIFSGPNENAWMSWFNGTTIEVAVYDYDKNEVLAATTLETPPDDILNIVGSVTDTTAKIFYEIDAVETYDHYIRTNTMTLAGSAGTPSNLLRSVGLASKYWSYNNRNYFLIVHDSTLQASYFISDEDGNIVGKIAPTNGGTLIADTPLSGCDSYNDAFIVPTQVKTRVLSEDGSFFTNLGVQYSIVDFNSTNQFQNTSLTNFFIVGGILQTYDGVSLVEHGFNVYPENISNSPATTGGSIENGTRSYVVCYEWTDNLGQIMRSAPSLPLSVTNTGSNVSENTLTIPTLRLTAKQDTRAPVRIVVYRTEAAGTIYYRVSSLSSPTLNDTTVDSVTFVDSLADTSIISNDVIYTTGDVVENSSPPNCSMITTFKDQLVLSGLENPLQFWISKEKQAGVCVEFSDGFSMMVDSFGGDVTGLSKLDDKIIFFKESSIFYSAGDGFNNTGTQNNLQKPLLITSDVGCTNINSIVIVPDGIMFRSAKGIYLLTRGLETVYIGAEAEDYNDLVITSAVLNADSDQVLFTTESGKTIVYNYLFKQWATSSNQNGVDSAIYENGFTYVDSDGYVFLENKDSFADNESYIPLSMTTGWINFTGTQVLQRLYKIVIVGEYYSAHKLKVSVRYDFNPSFTEETYIDIPTITQNGVSVFGESVYGEGPYGEGPYGGVFPLYQFEVNLKRQRCQAISFKIEDIQYGDTIGEGFSLTNILFVAGIKRESNKLANNRTVGTT
ncbi:MAG: hypothetical protein KDB74_01460 [Flavobacteriales bacterium]|nr:hypothetical protein [Flavobacteriales bacterium]